MQKRLIKQLILLLVLPATVLIVVSDILVISEMSSAIKTGILAAILAIWGLYSIFTGRKISDSCQQVEKALKGLNEGTRIENGDSSGSHLFTPVLNSLDAVSKRMKLQQEELQNERVSRLRSVIDGQDQERQRLSRELHDGMGQSLIAIKLQLESAGNQSHSQMRASVDVAKGMIDLTIDEVRRVTNALIPAALNEFGLITALRTRCEEMANTAGIKVTFENTGSVDRLDNKSKTYLYRIAQEAITNTIKHARATQLDIKLQRTGQEVSLLVIDNGKGFIFDPVCFAHRNGIQNMRERVALLNGTFDLNSQPNTGTTIRVTIPFKTGNGNDTHHSGG
jgi:signal transduction histidine kinase